MGVPPKEKVGNRKPKTKAKLKRGFNAKLKPSVEKQLVQQPPADAPLSHPSTVL
jgi:hypothetical protein